MLTHRSSETTSIPTNPRTTRPVGYAFVDVSTADEAQKAIAELAGKFILDRKVSVQLARKPATAAATQAGAASGGAGGSGGEGRRRNSGRGRGRGRARGGRTGRGGRSVSCCTDQTLNTLMLIREFYQRQANEDTNVPDQAEPLTESTNESAPVTNGVEDKSRAPRQPRQRGPPEDGIPSKNKVMVANLPYDLSEEKVSFVGSLISKRIV